MQKKNDDYTYRVYDMHTRLSNYSPYKKALLLVPSDEINAAKLDALSTIYITIPSKAPWLHVHISKEMTSGTIVHLQKI